MHVCVPVCACVVCVRVLVCATSGEELHSGTLCCVSTAGGTSEKFKVNTGVR